MEGCGRVNWVGRMVTSSKLMLPKAMTRRLVTIRTILAPRVIAYCWEEQLYHSDLENTETCSFQMSLIVA